jgi:transcriptional regulator with XRE-family HTH domain
MFKDNLKQLRKDAGLTQSQLAEKLGISFKTLSHWESGYTEPSILMLTKLKEIFAISYEDLLE